MSNKRELPQAVASALRVLLARYDLSEIMSAESPLEVPVAEAISGTDDDARVAGEESLTAALGEEIRAAHVVGAFVDSLMLDAIEDLFAVTSAEFSCPGSVERWNRLRRVHDAHMREAVSREVALLTGCSVPVARDKVAVACAGPRHRSARHAMREGIAAWDRVRLLHQRSRHLEPALVDEIGRRVLAPSKASTLNIHSICVPDIFGGVRCRTAVFGSASPSRSRWPNRRRRAEGRRATSESPPVASRWTARSSGWPT